MRTMESEAKSLETKLTILQESISEATDLETVNKLDIINLKNEIEKIKMALPLNDEAQINEIRQMLADIPPQSLSKDTQKRLTALEKRLASLNVPKQSKAPDVSSLKKRIAALERAQKPPPRLDAITKEVAALRSRLHAPPTKAGKEWAALQKRIAALEKRPRAKAAPAGNVQGLKKQLTKQIKESQSETVRMVLKELRKMVEK